MELEVAMIQQTERFVKHILGHDSTGHDWFHIDRVRKNAIYIYEHERQGDPFIIEMAALLHDIPDEKLNDSLEEGEQKLFNYLESLAIDEKTKKHITDIIFSISFKGGNGDKLSSIEAMIVQDADRLDAIGAMGVARAFAYGGKKGQAIYDPSLLVRDQMTVEEYRKGKSSSIHHFYEKLLKLKDGINTATGKKLAAKRHGFMELFLQEFHNDWNGIHENDLD